MYWIYILECENSTYYTGITTDLKRRYSEHLKGTCKSKYTRAHKVRTLASCWHIDGGRGVAQKIEYKVRKLSHIQKKNLINDPHEITSYVETLVDEHIIITCVDPMEIIKY